MRAIFILIITIFIGGYPSLVNETINDSQNCSAELTVDKNRSFKSATENGAEFKLLLKNTSQNTTSYTLSANKLLKDCSNKTHKKLNKSIVKNSNLEVSFKGNKHDVLSKNSSNKNEIITLEAGESKEFKFNAYVPAGTTYKTWSCIEIKANATNCKSISASIILSIYIPDPSEG